MKSKNAVLSAIVKHGAVEMGIPLPSNSHELFRLYFNFLEKRNRIVNLTALSGPEDIANLHFLDSIALLKIVSFKNSRVIDIGSGAGFPGVPLKIAEPSVDLTLLDATGKRVTFLSDLCAVLGLCTTCVNARAEDASHKQDMRERYDIAVSRGLARLSIQCELCLPFVRVGGTLISMKGTDSADEISSALTTITALGAYPPECYDYLIPGTNISHRAIVIRKASITPEVYPRRYAKIIKIPL